MQDGIFIDWLTISQSHTDAQPVLFGGETVFFDGQGHERSSRIHHSRFVGSHSTSYALQSNGTRVLASGNFGRYSREDNLFNFGFSETVQLANQLVMAQGIDPFTTGHQFRNYAGRPEWSGASVRRMDITCNYATGSMSAARDFIRWLQAQSKKRIKQGMAGDESVWFVNTREMLKAYLKAPEMLTHGMKDDSQAYQWAMDCGLVRIELELKRKTLSELGLYWLGDVTMEKIVDIFRDKTEIIRRLDRSTDSDILDDVPVRHRAVAAAWLSGSDVKNLVSRASFFRHKKALMEYGLDIAYPRNIHRLPVKVREIELKPLSLPSWYQLKAA
jgi:X family protein/replication protein CRI